MPSPLDFFFPNLFDIPLGALLGGRRRLGA